MQQKKGVSTIKRLSDSAIIEGVLSAGGSLSAAATRLGVARSTIYRRFRQSETIRKAITDAQDIAVQSAAFGLADACETAVDVLVRNMRDKKLPATVRTAAADAVLRHCGRYVELGSITQRLGALERQVTDNARTQ